MVEVAAPEGWQPPPEIPRPRAKPAPKPLPEDDLPDTASKPFEDFDDIDSLLTAKSTGPARTSSNNNPRRAGSTKSSSFHGSIDASATPIRPPTAWTQSGASMQRKKFALQIAAVVILFVVAIALVIVLTTTLFKADPDSISSRNGGASKSNPAQPDDSNTSAENGKASPNPPTTNPTARNGTATAARSALDARGMYPPRLDIPPMSLSVADSPPITPPGFEVETQPAGKSPTAGLIEQFGDFNGVLDGGESQLSSQELADATGAERGQIGIGTVFVRKPDAIEIDVAVRLKLPIAQLSFQEISLVDAVRTLSEISMIAICYEVELIEVAAINLSEKISLEQAETTVGAALDTMLQLRGLIAIPQNGFVLVTTADREQWVTRDVDLGVLKPDDPAIAERFAEFIQAAFAQKTWQAAGGQGTIQVNGLTLSIHQTAPVHALIARLVNKLSAAKKLTTDPNDEGARAALQSRRLRSQVARQADVALNLPSDKRLETVLSMLTANAGTEVLVNWQSLLPEGWTPETLIPWESRGEPLEQKLSNLTDSMNLTSRVIDDHTLQITTHADVQRQLELEVYPCGDLLQKYSVEQLTKIFDNVLGSQVNRQLGMSVTLESTNQCWIAILPQPLQIRFEAGLSQLRKEIAAAKQ